MTAFKYRLLDDRGNETGFFNLHGEVGFEILTLDKQTIPLEIVLAAVRRENRVVLVILNDIGVGAVPDTRIVRMAINSGNAPLIKKEIDHYISTYSARLRRQQFEQAGRGAQVFQCECPICEATIDLSGLEPTREMYCPYCETIAFQDPAEPHMGDRYRLCDECGYFSEPRPFTSFYFVFFLVVYSFSSRTTTRCHACMRSEAWKMLAGNLLFVFGVPVAIVQLFRAYFASYLRSHFRELDAANSAAMAGQIDTSEQLYHKILTTAPQTAGIHYNRARAFFAARDAESAIDVARTALRDCANYRPAMDLIVRILRIQNRTSEAEAQERIWNGIGPRLDKETTTHIKEM